MTDSIEQKIDKLTVVKDKLVMEDKGQNRPFQPWVYQSNRGRGQTGHNYNQRRFQDRFRPNNVYRGWPSYGQDYRVEQDLTLITEVPMGIIQEVVKGMGGLIVITIIEGGVTEVKITIVIGVGHMKSRVKIEGTVETLAIVDQGQVQGQIQIEIELDALSVGNMIILHWLSN